MSDHDIPRSTPDDKPDETPDAESQAEARADPADSAGPTAPAPAHLGRPAAPGLRSALWLPLFDELAEPAAVARLAADAEEAGWHGLFVWDHLSWRSPIRDVADPWITLAAIAGATDTLRLGPMVTPLARRRPTKVARETATLDRLSGGRLTLGVGLGSDRFADELRATGDETDPVRRGRMLDESLEILTAAWSGEPVRHHGRHHTVDDMTFLPRPVQRPGVPVWAAGFPGNAKPLRRAARHDGFFPINLDHPDRLAAIVDTLTDLRPPSTTPYDIAVALPPGTDPTPYAEAGATWWLAEFAPDTVSVDQVRGVLHDGPIRL
ncbi:luciferase [Embleya scabrispora]|uniref:Luciferase n=1 Tax=Embleya scabrispora TaxID=159449 RepID=A0A1T3NMQ0_9ACTN|nr:LLM class flavin-dependent oxidoreductase [Embleya scabrispora]OPC78002.1 luciferase [Embleya scabrispora]